MNKNIFLKSTLFVAVMLLLVPFRSYAQSSDANTFDLSTQWQFNAPLGNDFASTASAWGVNIDGFYNVTDSWAVGGFLSWSTNNEYFPRHTIVTDNGAINMDHHNSIFQVPFGLGARYKFRLADRRVVPYLGGKLGASYARQNQYSNIFIWEEDRWGFYASPEVGFNFYPFAYEDLGFNLSAYYSYSTNKFSRLSTECGLHNLGFRVGVVFKIK